MGRWSNKFVIGLTGNIAMGKSVVRKMLEHLGAYTIDADGLAHQTMLPGAPAYHPIIESFGRWILDPDGKINRVKLGAVAFAHPDALARLEAITHPLVERGIDALIHRAEQPVIVIEAIKLLEGPLAEQVDAIWVVDADPQVQLARLMEKRGLTEQEARKRITSQNAQRLKLERAGTVLTNNGSLQDLYVQVEREWRKIPATRGLRQADDRVGTMKIAPQHGAAPQPPSRIQPLPQPPTPAKRQTGPLPVLDNQAMQPPAPPRPGTGPLTPPSLPKTGTFPALPAEVSVDIRRGSFKTAELIATIISQTTGKPLTRQDVMERFGEKSYLLAEVNGKVLGLAGFQVENLITRLDEFIIISDPPLLDVVGRALVQAVEDASHDLQSEVNFVFLPVTVAPHLKQVFIGTGYGQIEVDSIKVPVWREAVQESQPPNTIVLSKRLREKLQLKPN